MDNFSKYLEVISMAPESSYFADCGFVACDNSDEVNGNTLIVGMNPREPVDGKFAPTTSYPNPFVPKPGDEPKGYFSALRKFIPKAEWEKTGYLDLLPFYEREQDVLLSHIRGNEAFVARVMAVTQAEIERISPSLIILANKAVWPYFGASDDCVWMGYDFEQVAEGDIPSRMQGRGFDVRIIRGFRQDPKAKEGIIYRPADGICRLEGTAVLFYKHSRGLREGERLEEQDYRALSAFAAAAKSKYSAR